MRGSRIFFSLCLSHLALFALMAAARFKADPLPALPPLEENCLCVTVWRICEALRIASESLLFFHWIERGHCASTLVAHRSKWLAVAVVMVWILRMRYVGPMRFTK